MSFPDGTLEHIFAIGIGEGRSLNVDTSYKVKPPKPRRYVISGAQV